MFTSGDSLDLEVEIQLEGGAHSADVPGHCNLDVGTVLVVDAAAQAVDAVDALISAVGDPWLYFELVPVQADSTLLVLPCRIYAVHQVLPTIPLGAAFEDGNGHCVVGVQKCIQRNRHLHHLTDDDVVAAEAEAGTAA
ncbi:hypothetical protein WICPIJ_008876 [Wickerhamomyces pijperi]|uniref:Uncharacterized protein n=1 Tax=Wickerhamomyces pijperi TaxID=599730 RepID=A0A9P8TGQ7_WICPI|nr:hypothetical protein WICPIJ_008876 [Wickerhamomyces pijperi]